MVKASTRYIVDEKGRKKAVVIDLKEYRKLLERIEDMEDALDIEQAVRNETEFISLEDFEKEIRQRGDRFPRRPDGVGTPRNDIL